RASFTVRLRPSHSISCRLRIASSIASWVSISTNPKPRDRPVSRSEITSAERTVPYSPNSVRSLSEVIDHGKLPTYNFFPIQLTLHQTERIAHDPTDRRANEPTPTSIAARRTCVYLKKENRWSQ